MNPCQLTTLITGLANTLAKGLTTEQISLLAAVLVQLGDTLATISIQQGILSNQTATPPETASADCFGRK